MGNEQKYMDSWESKASKLVQRAVSKNKMWNIQLSNNLHQYICEFYTFLFFPEHKSLFKMRKDCLSYNFNDVISIVAQIQSYKLRMRLMRLMWYPYFERLQLYLHYTMLVRCSQPVEQGQKLLAFFLGKGTIAVFILYSSTCQNSHISEISLKSLFELMVKRLGEL